MGSSSVKGCRHVSTEQITYIRLSEENDQCPPMSILGSSQPGTVANAVLTVLLLPSSNKSDSSRATDGLVYRHFGSNQNPKPVQVSVLIVRSSFPA
jgi:hypothetical protein